MKRTGIVLAVIGACMLMAPTVAQAQATRTWISGVGDDVNPCSRTAPCKTFPGAIAKTAAGGEIDTLDPGGFGGVTVTKAITLADEGVGEGGILVAGTNGVTVNCVSDPNCVVVLRGLQIDGGPTGSNSLAGVKFIAGKALFIQHCVIRNFTGGSPNGFGVSFAPSSGAAQLYIDDTTIENNGLVAGTGGGISIAPTGNPTVTATIRRSQSSNNNQGLRVDTTGASGGSVNVTVSDSEMSNNFNAGISSLTNGSAMPATMSIDRTVVSNNLIGLSGNGSNTIMRIGNSTVQNNATAFKNTNSATMTSFGNNNISDNAAIGTALGSLPAS